jgi:nucleoside-diphosphate-sugar epimerase
MGEQKALRRETMPVRKVLITGVYGLIGNVVYDRLCEQPDAYEVYGLARRRYPSDRVAAGKRIEIPDERFTLSDLSDLAVLEGAMSGIDTVVHMAADPNLEAGWESILASNLVGPRNVFEAARRCGVRRVIYASSVTVNWGTLTLERPYSLLYEKCYDELSPADLPIITKEVPPRPSSYYPASKVWGEALARVYADTHGMSMICLRIGGVQAEDRPPFEEWWARALWLSQRDVAQMVQCAIEAPDELRYDVFYVVSNNRWCCVDIDSARLALGYAPQDNAEEWLAK